MQLRMLMAKHALMQVQSIEVYSTDSAQIACSARQDMLGHVAVVLFMIYDVCIVIKQLRAGRSLPEGSLAHWNKHQLESTSSAETIKLQLGYLKKLVKPALQRDKHLMEVSSIKPAVGLH